MNKKLLAAAVGATLAAAPLLSAQAEVKLFGRIQVAVVSVNSDNGSTVIGTTKSDGTQMGDTNGNSRWGIDASENLGNGIKAIGRVAWQLDPSNGVVGSNSASQVARDQFAGLTGGFGTVKFGRLPSSYKMFGGVVWDPWAATFLQARRSGGMSGGAFAHNGFINDLMEYTTPKGLGGLKAQVQYSVDKTSTDKSYNVGVSWTGGPIQVIGAVSHDAQATGSPDNKKIGARFKTGGMFVYAQYEDVENGGDLQANGNKIGGGAKVTKGKFAVVGAGFKFGNNMVAGNIGQFNADNSCSSCVDADYYAIGLYHFLSKHTRVYAGYSHINAKTVDKVDQYGAGIRFDF
jgi:predicted porin